MEKKGFLDSMVDGAFNLALSKDKAYERIVLLLVLIGFIIRIPAALNLYFLADDAIYASQSAGIIASHILSTHSHPALFFYLTDAVYRIFGYTTFASRFWPLVAGSMCIILAFLIGKRLFNKEAGTWAAFFVTFSNLLVRMTYTEQSLVTLFFIFLGTYLGLKYLDSRKLCFLIPSAISFGLGNLTKYNSPFFIISFLIFSAYSIWRKKEKIFTKENVWHLFIFAAVITLISMPFLVFNYLTFKQSGIMDFQFTRIFRPENGLKLMSGLGGQDKSFIQSIFTLSNYANYNLLYISDIVIFIFGLIGIGFMFARKRKDDLMFLLLFIVIPFILQSAGNALVKHFVFLPFLWALGAGYGLYEILERIKNKPLKYLLVIAVLIFSIINLGTVYGTPHNYLTPSGNSLLKSYINSNVGPSDLLVIDGRFYTAFSFWLATDYHFLLLQEFPQFYSYDQNTTSKVMTKVYTVECLEDDCGWGWVKDNHEFNQTSESILTTIRNSSKEIETIRSYDYSGNELIGPKILTDKYKIYLMELPLNPALVESTKYIHSFYFAPFMYLNMKDYVFNYKTDGFDSFLNSFSLFVIYLSMVLAVISFIYAFYLLTEEESMENPAENMEESAQEIISEVKI